ncbi:MAG TPA: ABC transporter substrate-binding protein [Stellaceae bacterium]|nr:ABC transporter substrate-binding protein [Stellaceae bacterium]
MNSSISKQIGKWLLAAALCLLAALPARAEESVAYGSVGGPSAALWPLLIAQTKGLFTASGVKVEVIYAPSSAAVQQQLAAGSMQMGDGGLNDPIRAIYEGAPIALVRLEGQVPPYALNGKPQIKSIKELRGKTIMIGGAKDITLTYLKAMLEPNGLKDGDYDLTYAGSTIARFSALQSGAVDAAMLFPPFNFHAAAAGFSDLGLVYEYMKLPFLGMVANRPWALQHKQALAEFLDAYGKAVAWYEDPKNRAEAAKILVDASHQTQADTEQSYDFYRKIGFFEPKGEISRKKIQGVIDTLKSEFTRPFSVDQMFLPGDPHVVD